MCDFPGGLHREIEAVFETAWVGIFLVKFESTASTLSWGWKCFAKQFLHSGNLCIYLYLMKLHFASHQNILCLCWVEIIENRFLLEDEIVNKMSRLDIPYSYLKEMNVIVKLWKSESARTPVSRGDSLCPLGEGVWRIFRGKWEKARPHALQRY